MIVHLGPSILGLLDKWFTPELYPEPSLNVYMPQVGTGDISSVQRYVFLFLLSFSFVCFSMYIYICVCSCMFRYMQARGCIVNVCAVRVGARGQHQVFFSFEIRSLSLASGAHQGQAADQESPRHPPVSASPSITWLCKKMGFIF